MEADIDQIADKVHKLDINHKEDETYEPDSNNNADKVHKPDNKHKVKADEVGSGKADSLNLSASLSFFGQKC